MSMLSNARHILEIEKALIPTMDAIDLLSAILIEKGLISDAELDKRFEDIQKERGHDKLLETINQRIENLDHQETLSPGEVVDSILSFLKKSEPDGEEYQDVE